MYTYQKLKRFSWWLAAVTLVLVALGYHYSLLHSLLFLIIVVELAGAAIGTALIASEMLKEFEKIPGWKPPTK